jgi:hypothetical protein
MRIGVALEGIPLSWPTPLQGGFFVVELEFEPR